MRKLVVRIIVFISFIVTIGLVLWLNDLSVNNNEREELFQTTEEVVNTQGIDVSDYIEGKEEAEEQVPFEITYPNLAYIPEGISNKGRVKAEVISSFSTVTIGGLTSKSEKVVNLIFGSEEQYIQILQKDNSDGIEEGFKSQSYEEYSYQDTKVWVREAFEYKQTDIIFNKNGVTFYITGKKVSVEKLAKISKSLIINSSPQS